MQVQGQKSSIKNNLAKEWGLIENKIQNWSCTMAQAGQQNFPEKVTGCNSWGKKVLPFGTLLLELPVDL